MGLGINYVILANHLVSLITSSTTDPWIIMSLFSLKKMMYLYACNTNLIYSLQLKNRVLQKKTKKTVQFLHYLGEIIRGERQFTNSKIISSREIHHIFFLISGEEVPDIRNTSLEETILIFFSFLQIFYIIF